MVKYKKKICLLIAISLCLLLIGCKGSYNGPEPVRDTDSKIGNTRDITLTLIVPVYSDNSKEWWKNFKASFEDENPDVSLEVECFEWDKMHRSVDTIISSEAYPDAVLIDVEPSFSLEEEEESPIIEEKPVFASRRKLLVNTDILEKNGIEEPPSTWQELLEDCRSIKRGTGEIPFGLSLMGDEAVYAFSCFVWNAGGGLTDENGIWSLDSSLNAYAMEFEKRLISSGYTNPKPTEVSASELTDMFAEGKIAMMIAPDSALEKLEETEKNYEFINIPAYEDRESVTYLAKESFYIFDIGEEEEKEELRRDALERFYEAFFEKDTLDSFVESEGETPYTELEATERYMSFPAELNGWELVKSGIIDIQNNLFQGEESIDTLTRLQEDILLYLVEKQ